MAMFSEALSVDVLRMTPYTVATVPSASELGVGAVIYVTNGAQGSPILAVSNGTNWLRQDTGAAIAAQ